jgi:AbrB family looped-hinge helix DNA binding protein
MISTLGRITESGRISIPAEFRKSMGLQAGGQVMIELTDGELRIRTVDETVARAQALTRELLGNAPDASVAAFLRHRREDAKRE